MTIVSLMAYQGCAAQASSYGELQAAYLYNFVKYIKWPTEPEKFVIGFFGDEEMMNVLEKTLKEKKVRGREVILKKVATPEESLECHVVYLSESSSGKFAQVKDAAAESHILIVTEKDMIKKGAAISFVVEDERLRFKLKRAALSEAGLVPTEGLLKLAILF
jgi:hypothetical protein